MSDGFDSFEFSAKGLKLRADACRTLKKKRVLDRMSDGFVIGTEYEWLEAHQLLWDHIFEQETNQLKEWSGGRKVAVEKKVVTVNAHQAIRNPPGEITYVFPLGTDGLDAGVTLLNIERRKDVPALDWPDRWYKLRDIVGIGGMKGQITFAMTTVSVIKDRT